MHVWYGKLLRLPFNPALRPSITYNRAPSPSPSTEGTFVNGAHLLPRHEHVYNLGNVLFLESFPFISAAELRRRGAEAALEPEEGSGSEPELSPELGLGRYEVGLGLGLEGVESFAGEAGLPEGMVRADGVLEASSPAAAADTVMDGP